MSNTSLVFSYLRFSRPEQMKGDSERRQWETTQKWVQAEGHILDKSLDLRDLGVSAFRGKNSAKYGQGQLGLFLECIEAGKVPPGSILAVESLDRITRQELDDALQLFRQILKGGVSIKTFVPNELLTPEDLNNPFKMMYVLMILSRAHEESATKSERLKAAWQRKRRDAHKEKLTANVPGWLVLDQGVIHPIPERVEVVRQVFQMCIEGYGIYAIMKHLNQSQVSTWGRAEYWREGSIRAILRSRAAIGEYQPHITRDGKKESVGDAVKDYYPHAVDDGVFYAAQMALEERKLKRGKVGSLINLFTGLVLDARDGRPMYLANKDGTHRLVSSSTRLGLPGPVSYSFPYEDFEQSILASIWDLQLGDVLPTKAVNIQGLLMQAEGELADIQNRIKIISGKIRKAKEIESLLEILATLEQDKKDTKAKIERLKSETLTGATNALERTRELILKLNSGKDVRDLRIKLRSTLGRIIENITFLTFKVNRTKAGIAEVQLKSGQRRTVQIVCGEDIFIPKQISKLDVRRWKSWPEKLKARNFEVLDRRMEKMVALDKQGVTRTEIARELGCTTELVCKTLIQQGRPKHKKGDPAWRMTWNGANNRWCKKYQKKVHFVTTRQLKRLFPELVESLTSEGSWRAANSWWEQKVVELDGGESRKSPR